MSADGNPGLTVVISRLGERVAALEARSVAEIAALKDDTAHIRSTQHEFANQMQVFISATHSEQTLLREHVKLCDARSARLEKVSFAVLGLLITLLGLLLNAHFLL